jgi:hypothetical protein
VAELIYWEIDGAYTLCDGVWHFWTAVNPAGRPIQVKSVELALAIDNGTTGDIGLYLDRMDVGTAYTRMGVGSFTIQQPYTVQTMLRQRVDFGADWITVPAGATLKLSSIGSPNYQPPRNYIPVARMYYI